MTQPELRLLFVGGRPEEASLIRKGLKDLAVPVSIDLAPGAAKGLELLSDATYDLVVAALARAGMTGGIPPEELVPFKLRRPDVPLAVLGEGEGEELAAALHARAQDFLARESLHAEGPKRILALATDTHHAEYRLRELRSRQAALLAATRETVIGIRADGTCSFCKLSAGFPTTEPSSLIGKNVAETLPRPLVDAWVSYRDQVARGRTSTKTVEIEIPGQGGVSRFAAQFARVSEAESLVSLTAAPRSSENEERNGLPRRLESLGHLAGGIAHDFNNALTVIQGNAELSLAALEEASDPEQRDLIEEIRDATTWATNLTRQLLAFSRNQIRRPVPLDLNGLVRESESMVRRLVGEHVELEIVLAQDLDVIMADPSQLRQILENLVINAGDAMPRGGRLLFETENVDVHETYAGQEMRVKSGPYVALAVSDTGIGMDVETRQKALEPFFTTNRPGRRAGLGLSMVYWAVKTNGGYLWLHSEQGKGTTVEMYFPRYARAGAPEASMQPSRARSHGATILLVEDDPSVLQIARRFLGDAGYNVIEAKDASEALAIVADNRDPIHLLATDVAMSIMSGTELAARISAVHPDLKVLYMSGYTRDTLEQRGLPGTGVHFLQKPFDRDKLLNAVRRVLGDDPA